MAHVPAAVASTGIMAARKIHKYPGIISVEKTCVWSVSKQTFFTIKTTL